jgi:hypothetical protein
VRYNPLDLVDPAHRDAYDLAPLLAAMLVVPEADRQDPFWDDEAASPSIPFPSSDAAAAGACERASSRPSYREAGPTPTSLELHASSPPPPE